MRLLVLCSLSDSPHYCGNQYQCATCMRLQTPSLFRTITTANLLVNNIHNVGMVKVYNKYVIVRKWRNIDTR